MSGAMWIVWQSKAGALVVDPQMLKLAMSEGKMEWETARCSVRITEVATPVCHGKERAELEGKALNFPISRPSYPHLWLRPVGSDRKNEIANTSGHVFPPHGGWAKP